MPIALFALTVAAYAIGTTEFVIVGLLPTVVFFLIFQRTLSRGLTAGAIKE